MYRSLIKSIKCMTPPLIKHQTATLHTSTTLLAGHSKWANIKHVKALKDGQKAAIFTKLGRQIRLAVQEGGSPNPALNSSLRSIVDEALRKNMPGGTIDKIIKKAASSPQDKLKKFVIEIKVANKAFVVCVAYTDNLVGFKMNIAPLLKKSGAVYTDSRHMFKESGVIQAVLPNSIDIAAVDEQCVNDAIECDAEEFDVIDADKRLVEFTCHPEHIEKVRTQLAAKGYTIENSEHLFVPNATIHLGEMEQKLYNNLIEKFTDITEIESIFDNVAAS